MKMKRNMLTAAIMIAAIGLGAGAASAGINDGLVEYWKLDGDYSAQVTPAHVGTQIGTAAFAAGKFGQAIDLESSSGTHSWITAGGPEGDFDFASSDMSVSMWYTTENLHAKWQGLVGKGDGGAWRLARASNSTTSLKFNVGGPTVNAKLNIAGWHHVVATVDADTDVKIYVDGVLAASKGSGHNNSNTPYQMAIGSNGQHNNRAWDGMIDDVGVWDRVLTADEVASIWNNGDGASIESLGGEVPEPATMSLIGLAVAGLGGYIRKRRKA